MRRRRPIVLGVVILAVVAGVWFVPSLDRSRPEIASTPTVRPFATQVRVNVAPGARACVGDAIFEPVAQSALVQVDTRGRPGPPLRVTATAPGYSAGGSVAGGYPDGAAVLLPLSAAAPREIAGGALCIVNGGRHLIGLVGPGDLRSISGAPVTVEGRPGQRQFSVTLMSRSSPSIASRAGRVLQRASAFRPVGRGVLWPLAILVVAGVPLLALAALARALAADAARRDAEPRS
jgi:hypothetical protein